MMLSSIIWPVIVILGEAFYRHITISLSMEGVRVEFNYFIIENVLVSYIIWCVENNIHRIKNKHNNWMPGRPQICVFYSKIHLKPLELQRHFGIYFSAHFQVSVSMASLNFLIQFASKCVKANCIPNYNETWF